MWGDEQLVPHEGVDLATTPHINTLPTEDGTHNADFTADLYVITTPHRVRLSTGPSLELHGHP